MRMKPLSYLSGLSAELLRRRVYPVVVAYALVSWVVLQIGEVTFEPLGIPGWIMRALILVVIAGFPVAAILAWKFDITPSGIRRDRNRMRRESPPVDPDAGMIRTAPPPLDPAVNTHCEVKHLQARVHVQADIEGDDRPDGRRDQRSGPAPETLRNRKRQVSDRKCDRDNLEIECQLLGQDAKPLPSEVSPQRNTDKPRLTELNVALGHPALARVITEVKAMDGNVLIQKVARPERQLERFELAAQARVDDRRPPDLGIVIVPVTMRVAGIDAHRKVPACIETVFAAEVQLPGRRLGLIDTLPDDEVIEIEIESRQRIDL